MTNCVFRKPIGQYVNFISSVVYLKNLPMQVCVNDSAISQECLYMKCLRAKTWSKCTLCNCV